MRYYLVSYLFTSYSCTVGTQHYMWAPLAPSKLFNCFTIAVSPEGSYSKSSLESLALQLIFTRLYAADVKMALVFTKHVRIG